MGKGNASGSASTTSVPPSPLGLSLRVPHIDERLPTQRSVLSRTSEFTILRTPNRPPPNSSQRWGMEGALARDYRSSRVSSRRVAFDLDQGRYVVFVENSSRLLTLGLSSSLHKTRCMSLEDSECVTVSASVLRSSALVVIDQKSPQFLYGFLPSSGVEGRQWSGMVQKVRLMSRQRLL